MPPGPPPVCRIQLAGWILAGQPGSMLSARAVVAMLELKGAGEGDAAQLAGELPRMAAALISTLCPRRQGYRRRMGGGSPDPRPPIRVTERPRGGLGFDIF